MSTAEEALVGFARALRGNGLTVGTGQLAAYCASVGLLDTSDADDLYWAGRACLVTRHDDVATYDRVFRSWFGAGAGIVLRVSGDLRRFAVAVPAGADGVPQLGPQGRDATSIGSLASSLEVLRHKRFADCTPEERAELNRLMARLRLITPRRRSRRTTPALRGDSADLRRSIRRSLRSQGELIQLARRDRRMRHRRLVLILDVSGSMAASSRALLQFAHTAARGAHIPAEVFCFGTRLTRVTHELRLRQPDLALARAAEAVVDWEGGTRIGDSIGAFVRTWGRRGLARGAVVVICSDGLDRGDPAVLAANMAKLSRLAHRIVWVNPLKGDPRYQPLAGGMQAALPLVDEFISGHDLASLEALARLLPKMV